MITARRNDHHITRNCSHFKPFSGTLRETNTESDLESDESMARNFGHARAVNTQTWENLKQYGYAKP